MNFNKSEKKINEFQSTFLSMKEDEPCKININSCQLFQNETRNNMVKWLQFLCETLNFNNQTLFRSVIIFDKYLSSSKNLREMEELTQEKLNLIAIACLSLGTKLEEINCNYVSFFTEKVLNLPDCQIFTVKDLTKMEMNVLKELKYKTLYTTSYDFMLFYLEIFKYYFNPSSQFIYNVRHCTELLMKQNIMNNIFLNMNQSDYALACLNQTFIQIGMNIFIINQIRNILMLFDMNKLFKKNKSLIVSNRVNDNIIINNNDDNIHNNLEFNFLSLPSF
jgi:hypothetical protein